RLRGQAHQNLAVLRPQRGCLQAELGLESLRPILAGLTRLTIHLHPLSLARPFFFPLAIPLNPTPPCRDMDATRLDGEDFISHLHFYRALGGPATPFVVPLPLKEHRAGSRLPDMVVPYTHLGGPGVLHTSGRAAPRRRMMGAKTVKPLSAPPTRLGWAENAGAVVEGHAPNQDSANSAMRSSRTVKSKPCHPSAPSHRR